MGEMQIEKTIVMPKSSENSLFAKESEADGEGTKRGISEFPQHECSTSNPRSGHVVYVRRKSEAEQSKVPQVRKPSEAEPSKLNQSEVPQISKPSEASVELTEANKSLSWRVLSAIKPSVPKPTISFHERGAKLQNLLEELEQSSQSDYIEMLRSLSSVELSRHAVELEKRSIQLSIEEGKELQRVRVFDVLGRYSTQQV